VPAMNDNLQHPVAPRRPSRPSSPPLPPQLRLEMRGGGGMPLRAAVYGEIDYASAFSMQVRIAAACRRRRARGLVLDLAGVELMSSSGLAAILQLQREGACLRGGLVLAAPSPEVRRVLEITGLDARLLVVETCSEAEVLLLYSAAGADVSPSVPRDACFN
jgi:anti-anti-sigma factor